METKKEAGSQLCIIGELKKKYKVADPVFEGVKAAQGWKDGRMVTEKEFTGAVESWKNASVNGVKEAKG